MPLPELNLSLSLTDNPGSPFYGGHLAGEKVSQYDSAYKQHTITIIISDEQVGNVTLQLTNTSPLERIDLPTYKMILTDDKTHETEIYQVTRDTPLLKKIAPKRSGIFSLFGINLLSKTTFSVPTVAFEPLTATLDKFEVSRYRTLRENFISYALRKETSNAFLLAGKIPQDFLNSQTQPSQNFFYVFDQHNGRRFIGDILYREKLIKIIPRVEIHLIKRTKTVKEIELTKKGILHRIIYLQ